MISENAKTRWIKDFENGVSLSFAPKSVQDNEELVMVAVNLNGMNLAFASDRLKANFDIVKCAINQNKKALQFADLDLAHDIIYKGIETIEKERKGLAEVAMTFSGDEFADFIKSTEDVQDISQLMDILKRLLDVQNKICMAIYDIQSKSDVSYKKLVR